LKVGDKVLRSNGKWTRITRIEYERKQITVYNFEVEGNHSYFVGDIGVLSHNCGIETARNIIYKGFSKGELAEHFTKHGAEFGSITQNQYLKMAKEFSGESGDNILEQVVGSIYVKYDQATRRVLVTNTGSREIRTFYIADARDANPFQAAVEYARTLTGN
jgi:hypothetical protein